MAVPRARFATFVLFSIISLSMLGAPTLPAVRAQTSSTGTLATAFNRAAQEFDVPRDVLVTIAYAETRFNDHNGAPSIDNGYGLMHLVDNPEVQTLPLAATILNLPAANLKTDSTLNIRGGAAVLRRYADEQGFTSQTRRDIAAWYPVVARYSNAKADTVARDYAEEVYRLLNAGVRGTSPSGEVLIVAAQTIQPQRGKYGQIMTEQALAPDYPVASSSWAPANPANYSVASRPSSTPIQYIIIHTVQGNTASAIGWFQNPAAQVSAQYIVSSNGQVIQTVREKDIAWQAGDWDLNTRSIGIEHEGYVDDPGAWYTDAMYKASAALTRNIALKYGIPMNRTRILAHSEVKSTKSDPGPGWNWTYFMQLVTQTPVTSARLVSARIMASPVQVGGVVPVQFQVMNTGTTALNTQAPAGGNPGDSASGWVYDEAECFLGDAANTYPAYDKVSGSLRVTLGFAAGSSTVAQSCKADTGGFPWRWGFGTTLQPGETRTIMGYVRFRTPGVYTLKASLNNENIKAYGGDGNGSDLAAGTVTVVPEQRAPQMTLFDTAMNPQASVYRLTPTPDSLLARTTNPLSAVEGSYVGNFAWYGNDINWGAGGPLGQADRYIVRQVRALYAPVSGVYNFRLTNDDGAWLWVDGAEVVRNPGLHPVTSATGSVYLSAGLHTLAVKFFENTGGAYMGYAWQQPSSTNFTMVPLPAGAEHVGAQFRLGQQTVLAADDLGGSGVRDLRLWFNGVEQQRSAKPVAVSLGAGAQTIEYQAEDNNPAGPNVSERARTVFTVDPNLQIRYLYLPSVRR